MPITHHSISTIWLMRPPLLPNMAFSCRHNLLAEVQVKQTNLFQAFQY
jgi:hypothetical protein